MKTNYHCTAVFLYVFCCLALPTPLSAQKFGPDQLAISGFKLGRVGGPDLKNEIEALPEGYKCLELFVNNDGQFTDDQYSAAKLLGYSCFAPEAPSSPYKDSRDYVWRKDQKILKETALLHMVFLFGEESGQVWHISKREVFPDKNNAPVRQTLEDALIKRYGTPTSSNNYSLCWSVGRAGVEKPSSSCSTLHLNSTPFKSLLDSSLEIPNTFSSDSGVCLVARFDESGYKLVLLDERSQYDQIDAAQTKAEAAQKAARIAEEERRKAIAAPIF